MKSDKNDWRLTGQEEYLYGKTLKVINPNEFAKTLKSANSWHEHCEFCMSTIEANSKKCYTTTDNYRWICEECYDDFKDDFKWTVK